MQTLPLYVYVVFIATLLLGIGLFFKATRYSKPFLFVLMLWIIVQSILGIAGFYNQRDTMTARFPLLILPPLLFLVTRFFTKKGRSFLDRLDLPMLTLFNVIRLPVEWILFWLFVSKSLPQAMTYQGRNFDIFSGLSAPVIYYFGFVKNKLNRRVIIAWNFICFALLLNVVATAVLSLPGRFQAFGFEQPNIALGYFPFLLLPACLVPLVILSMLASIRKLLTKTSQTIHNQTLIG